MSENINLSIIGTRNNNVPFNVTKDAIIQMVLGDDDNVLNLSANATSINTDSFAYKWKINGTVYGHESDLSFKVNNSNKYHITVIAYNAADKKQSVSYSFTIDAIVCDLKQPISSQTPRTTVSKEKQRRDAVSLHRTPYDTPFSQKKSNQHHSHPNPVSVPYHMINQESEQPQSLETDNLCKWIIDGQIIYTKEGVIPEELKQLTKQDEPTDSNSIVPSVSDNVASSISDSNTSQAQRTVSTNPTPPAISSL